MFNPARWRNGNTEYLKQPLDVWVSLSVVYPIGRPAEPQSDGLDLQAEVPGQLRMWKRTTTGHWAGFVTFPIQDGRGESSRVSQWVLAPALRPRHHAVINR
ncbi:hypothetical protein [Actinocrispum sp. NPDC049592]|uniref:hypothetical protein n=1 Tax=Actinocrispum sp. NPDC049592 TaxID=3154835 RepID=UPI003423911C